MKIPYRRWHVIILLIVWLAKTGFERYSAGIRGVGPLLLQTLVYLTTPESLFAIFVLCALFIMAPKKINPK